MKKNIIYPTMLTPFDDAGKVDYRSLEKFIGKLEKDGADGLFSVCQSSEMFNLTDDEKVKIASYVREITSLPFVVSGDTYTFSEMDEKINHLERMAETGAEAVILISNSFAGEKDDDEVFLKNLEKFLKGFNKHTHLGIYECPYPYKRLVSKRILNYIKDTGRFLFFKDTCCNSEKILKRLETLDNQKPLLYNANAKTLPCTMSENTRGYSGIHANVSVKLVRAVMEQVRFGEEDESAAYELLMELDSYLSRNHYPISAKYLLKSAGIFESIHTRVKKTDLFNHDMALKGKEIYEKIREFEKKYDSGEM